MVAQRAFFQGIAGLVALILLWPIFATSQETALPPGLLEQLNRTQPTTPFNPAQPLLSPLDQVRTQQLNQQPSAPPAAPQPSLARVPRTQIELDYSRRAGIPLLQYGYDVFRSIVPSRGDLQTGAVADNYRLSIGDELVITLQGQNARSLRTRIDSEGRVVIPDVPPVAAAGRTFGEVRSELEREVAARFLNTTVFVSVATVRQIAVSVLGEANAPGIYRMGGFATALDALAMAGGIKNTGSLRHIMLIRGNARSAIDLYGVMTGVGSAPDLGLADGDRLVIPPLGATVAVSSEVVRPGIYELAGGEPISVQSLLAFAGGPLRPSGNRFLKLSLDAQGNDSSTELASLAQQSLRAGDILMVLRRDDATVGSVKLDGNVRVPGPRSLAAAPDLRRLIGSEDAFLPGSYLPFGAVETTDPQTRARHLVPVDLAAVMSGRTNMPLRDGDTVIVLSLGDVNYLASADVQAVLEGRPPPLLRERIVTKNPRAVPLGPFAPEETVSRFGEAASTLVPQGQNAPLAVAAQQTNAAMSPQVCRGLQELASIAATARPGRFANAIYSISTGRSWDRR